jgi:hypothetical protein
VKQKRDRRKTILFTASGQKVLEICGDLGFHPAWNQQSGSVPSDTARMVKRTFQIRDLD